MAVLPLKALTKGTHRFPPHNMRLPGHCGLHQAFTLSLGVEPGRAWKEAEGQDGASARTPQLQPPPKPTTGGPDTHRHPPKASLLLPLGSRPASRSPQSTPSCFPRHPSLQQLLPGDGSGEDLPLQPQVVVDLEILGQVHTLAQHALQAVVHRQKIRVAVCPVIAT